MFLPSARYYLCMDLRVWYTLDFEVGCFSVYDTDSLVTPRLACFVHLGQSALAQSPGWYGSVGSVARYSYPALDVSSLESSNLGNATHYSIPGWKISCSKRNCQCVHHAHVYCMCMCLAVCSGLADTTNPSG